MEFFFSRYYRSGQLPQLPLSRFRIVCAYELVSVIENIALKLGEVVELRIRSLDTNHGFMIPEAGVNLVVPKRGKGDARVLFRAQRRGVFEFICSKPCGAGHLMMRGQIVVE